MRLRYRPAKPTGGNNNSASASGPVLGIDLAGTCGCTCTPGFEIQRLAVSSARVPLPSFAVTTLVTHSGLVLLRFFASFTLAVKKYTASFPASKFFASNLTVFVPAS